MPDPHSHHLAESYGPPPPAPVWDPSRESRHYAPADRPLVYVHRGGHWYRGTLHAWQPVEGGWYALVDWTPRVGCTFVTHVPASWVREDGDPDISGGEDGYRWAGPAV